MITPHDAREMRESYTNGKRYLVVSRFNPSCYIADSDEHDAATCRVIKLRDGLDDVVAEVLKWTRFNIEDNTDIELAVSYVNARLQNDGILAAVLVAYDSQTCTKFIQVNLSPTSYSRLADRAKAVACRAVRHQTFYVNVV